MCSNSHRLRFWGNVFHWANIAQSHSTGSECWSLNISVIVWFLILLSAGLGKLVSVYLCQRVWTVFELSVCMTSAMGYWATHRPQVNYTLSLCACVLTHVCMCSLGPPIVLGKLHTWVSPYVSSETTQPSAPLRLSHGTHMCSCCHHSLCYAHTHTHRQSDSVTAVRKHYIASSW